MILQTERLALRHWVDSDLPAFHRIWGDERVIFWREEFGLEGSKRQLEKARIQTNTSREGYGWWALVLLVTGEIIGNGLLKPANYADEVELGYHVAYDFQGQGYATEAGRAMLRHGFETMKLKRIVAAILPDNLASQRVAERLGMKKTRTVMNAGFLHDLWVLERDEWLAQLRD